MKTDFLIIGGGIAGLAAANQFIDRGADVTLIEEGSYPAHKICGEFLSPEALPLLAKWDIFPKVTIGAIRFVFAHKEWSMPLKENTASIPRFVLDAALAERAREKGVRMITGAKVLHIERGGHYEVTLASGDKIQAPALFLSAGRLMGKLTNQGPPPFCYVGVKAHFSDLPIKNELVMHLMPGAYMGIAPFSANEANVAGIIACSSQEAKNPKDYFRSFLERPESLPLKTMLTKGKCLFEEWLSGPIPEFGLRNPPQWENAYFLGDAAGVIPPATGNGLAMGLTSGIMAADFALKGSYEAYRKEWKRVFGGRIRRGKLLHALFLRPTLARTIPHISRIFPSLPQFFFRATRG